MPFLIDGCDRDRISLLTVCEMFSRIEIENRHFQCTGRSQCT